MIKFLENPNVKVSGTLYDVYTHCSKCGKRLKLDRCDPLPKEGEDWLFYMKPCDCQKDVYNAVVDQLKRQKETISYLSNLIEEVMVAHICISELRDFYRSGIKDAIAIYSGEKDIEEEEEQQ